MECMEFQNMESRAATQSNNWNRFSTKLRSVDQQVMSIVRTVLERCKKEKSNNCLQVPLEDYHERVSFYTGLPKMFVFHVIDDNPHKENSFDDKDHIILMECINIFLAGKQNVRIKDLFEEFVKHRAVKKSDTQYAIDLKTFESKLYSLKYSYKKNLNGPPLILIEEPKVKFYRFNYLFKIKKFRERNLQIYYVDEKHISKPPIKSPVINQDCNKEGYIFFHIVSVDGYENGMYVWQDASQNLEDIFKKWMLDIVLYSIKPGSVIVMANNFIHGSLLKKAITRYHSKKHMLLWLRDNNIPCDPNMNRPRLYELIEKCTTNSKDYDIDRIFKLHGHHVLRLPNNFSSLSPTKFLWDFINNLKFGVMDKNMESFKDFLLNFIMSIDKPKWSTYFDLTCDMENQIFEIDLLTEDLLENNCELDEKCFYEPSTNFNIEDFLE